MIDVVNHLNAWFNIVVGLATVVTAVIWVRIIILNLKEKLGEIEKWKIEHEKDASAIRGKYDGELGILAKQVAVGDNQFKQVARDIDEMKKDLRYLRNRRRDDRPDPDENEG